MRIKRNELSPGDVVEFGIITPWNRCVVKRVMKDAILLYRPYVSASDVVYAGQSVICLIGIEEFQLPRNDVEVEVLERKKEA